MQFLKRILITLLVIGGMLGATTSLAHAKTTAQPVPTIFIHGLQGSHKSTDSMIAAAEKQKGAKKVLTINVAADGTLQVTGQYSKKVRRPLIQINFENNTASIATQTQWLMTILQDLKRNDGVKKYNVVAHSAGNITLFETVTAHHQTLPTLNKYVILAGPFNGVIGMNDEPNQNKLLAHDRPQTFYPANSWYPSYRQLLKDAQHFPKHVKILNIYSDLGDGTHSDGQVTVQSEQSVNYLLRGRKVQLKNVKMTGLTHSGLHQSTRVNRLWIKFLW